VTREKKSVEHRVSRGKEQECRGLSVENKECRVMGVEGKRKISIAFSLGTRHTTLGSVNLY
jgi:hypothetical protein